MFVFVLIGLALVLVGIVGLQFTYMFYVERIYRERQDHLRSLERAANKLRDQLETANNKLAEQDKLLKSVYLENRTAEDLWADVIEDR